jgi:Skp family chaperone for outer membrane proteins
MRVCNSGWLKAVGLVGLGLAIGLAYDGPRPMNAKEVKKTRAPRIGYVNAPKVLRDFRRANQEGQKVTQRREEYVNRAKEERATLQHLTDQYNATDDGQLRKALQEKALATQRRIEAIDKEAKEKVTEMSDKAIVEMYEQIRVVIAEMAKDRDLDVVEVFPSATRPAEDRKPEVANLMLQTPALMPFYLKPEFDLTDEVIERLNKKYPE